MIVALQLFWKFFMIGLFTFGGGYAMIPLFRSELVPTYISDEMLTNFIGIAESTPGPFAVNMATFIGMENGGILTAALATLGVVLPSFLIILIIAWLGAKFLESKYVNNAFKGLKPVVIGLIISVAFTLIVADVFPLMNFNVKLFSHEFTSFPFFKVSTTTSGFNYSEFDFKGLIIMAIIFGLTRRFKKLSPILLIAISAVLGLLLYGLVPYLSNVLF